VANVHFESQVFESFLLPRAELELPVKPEKQWVHMGQLEPDKLEWTRDLPAPKRQGTKKVGPFSPSDGGHKSPSMVSLSVHLSDLSHI